MVIGGRETPALLDTGSTVSTICRSFYDEHFKGEYDLNPLDRILNIECAGGEILPYDGFIEISLTVPELYSEEQDVLLLVVPDTQYSARVPVVLGTNTLQSILDGYRSREGAQFLQNRSLPTSWWLSFRCLSIVQRKLIKAGGTLATVRCTSLRHMVIPRNGKITLEGGLCDPKSHAPMSAMIHPTKKTILPEGVELTPAVVRYSPDESVLVELANLTDRPIVVPPRAVLCELQHVDIEDIETMTVNKATDKSDQTNSSTDKQPTTDNKNDAEFLAQFNFSDGTDFIENEIKQAQDLLLEYRDIFSEGEFDIGHSTVAKHKIILTDNVPFKQRHRRIPPSLYKEVQAHLEQMVQCGVIRPSESPWASGVVLVRKKDGRLRFCVDYRQLNQRTVRDAYALPRIEETMDNLVGAKYFSCLDLRAGYYHVEVDEGDKPKTAFTAGPLGFWEFNRLPFGLTNAPATFQRIIEKSMGELHLREVLSYLDDLIVHGRGVQEHIARLRRVFQKIREAHLKLNAGKCAFFKREISYLGHIVSERGVEADPKKVEKIVNWPTPRNVPDVREFLGFAGYYRKFVRNFARHAKPLTDLLGGNSLRKKGKGLPLQSSWRWGPSQQESFECLKEKLTTPPILAYADYSLPFTLHTDASREGLGAILYQEQNGEMRVIAYASRSLNKSEQNYTAHKLEYLAVKWAVTDKFQEYLYGNRFTIYTDNNPLTYVLTTAKLDATGHRWLAALGSYNFDIHYRPGKTNRDADILSRLPKRLESEATVPDVASDDEYHVITRDAITAICQMTDSPYIDSMCYSTTVLDDPNLDMTTINYGDWRRAQHDDPILGPLMEWVTRNERPGTGQHATDTETLRLLREIDHLRMQRGVMYRNTEVQGQERLQLVLPQSYRTMALRGVHDDTGHLGRDKTLSLLRDRYYWPGMSKDVEDRVRNCSRCLHRKTTNTKAPLVSIKTVQPFELVCLDFLTLEMAKGGFQYVLVITDHFTRYAQAIPTRNMSARTTAEALFNHFIVHYGFPLRIHSDQGANFEGRLIRELCTIAGLEKSRTSPYHAMGNGMCERFNQTLMNMLGTLESSQKHDWSTHVGPLVHAYNASRHESTNYSPFYLMFGREPRLPIDVALGHEFHTDGKTYSKFVESLRERLTEAYQIATSEANKASDGQKKTYDRHTRDMVLSIGDRVLVRRLAFQGRHKLADRWEEAPYVVKKQLNPDIPVYIVRREDGRGRERTLHRNHLLPIGSIPIPIESETSDTKKMHVTKPKPPVTPGARDRFHVDPFMSESDDSDDELGVCAIVPQLPEDGGPTDSPEKSSNETGSDESNGEISDNEVTEETGQSTGDDDTSGSRDDCQMTEHDSTSTDPTSENVESEAVVGIDSDEETSDVQDSAAAPIALVCTRGLYIKQTGSDSRMDRESKLSGITCGTTSL